MVGCLIEVEREVMYAILKSDPPDLLLTEDSLFEPAGQIFDVRILAKRVVRPDSGYSHDQRMESPVHLCTRCARQISISQIGENENTLMELYEMIEGQPLEQIQFVRFEIARAGG